MIIEIILFKQELLHDINAALTRIERTRHLDDITLTTEGDDYSFDRQIESALADVIKRTAAYQCIPSQHAQRIQSNHTYDWQEKTILLNMPHEWLPANISPLRTACHNYIVHAVLYDQLSAMLPGDPYTLQLLEQKTRYYSDINAALLHQTKIHPTPFG